MEWIKIWESAPEEGQLCVVRTTSTTGSPYQVGRYGKLYADDDPKCKKKYFEKARSYGWSHVDENNYEMGFIRGNDTWSGYKTADVLYWIALPEDLDETDAEVRDRTIYCLEQRIRKLERKCNGIR